MLVAFEAYLSSFISICKTKIFDTVIPNKTLLAPPISPNYTIFLVAYKENIIINKSNSRYYAHKKANNMICNIKLCGDIKIQRQDDKG